MIDRVVICMKWGTLFPAEYVNVLYNACRANISGDFRFVCLTNETDHLLPAIEAYPIPLFGLDEWHYYDGAWPKMGIFLKDLYQLQGRALYLDLDTVVCGNIDEMFKVDGQLVALDFQPWKNQPGGPRAMGAILAFDLGSLDFLVERLRSQRDTMIKKYLNDQNYLQGEVPGIRYFPSEWIVSFKHHLRQPLIIDRFRGPKEPQAPVKIVAFHGRPRPIDLIRPPKGNWERFPHYGSGPVSWMRDYWTRHGGEI